MSDQELKPLSPEEGVEMYLETRSTELAEESVENQKYRLKSFVQFCNEEEIDNLNELDGRKLNRYRSWRLEGKGDGYDAVNKLTLKGNLSTLKLFLEFCASVDAVTDGLRERVIMPTLREEEESRDELLEPERAEKILENLEEFDYASRSHVIFMILWHTGMRLGSLRALDVDDFDYEERSLQLRHRPQTDTPLKNGEAAERPIAVGDFEAEVINKYIETNRPKVTDEYGRRPLIASDQGRLTKTPIRNTVYHLTQPCEFGDCPHGEEEQSCEHRKYSGLANCPSSRSPHCLRHGRLTKHRRDGDPLKVVSERCNASEEVIDRHYDERSEREKMEARREVLY